MERKRILVTGAAGLIGKATYEKLTTLGYSVTGVDNLSRPGSLSQKEIINCNLLDFYKKYKNNFDTIFHLAAINGTDYFYSQPNQVIENNFELDLATFRFAKLNGSKVVYASSSEVISGTANVPTIEETDVAIENIHNPRWSYRLSKIISENYILNSNLDYVIARFFNIFGGDSRQGHFVHDIVKKIDKEDFTLTGYNETRSFCYIDDAVNALLSIAFQQSKSVINIGNDEEITILDAANTIAEILYDKKIDWILKEGRPGSTARRCPNIDNLKKVFPNYKPLPFYKAIERIKNETNNIQS